MARFLKLIENLLLRPPEARFNDIVKVLEYFGWELKNVKGSHFVYHKEGYLPLTITKHKNKVKRGYIIKLIKILELEEWYEEQKE
jgi:predicted RNA binding protein YcfA (HicA-like mRNA interferase family)